MKFDSARLKKPSNKLHKENKVKTIYHSLAIEGNSLTEQQISFIVDGKKIIGSKNQIRGEERHQTL